MKFSPITIWLLLASIALVGCNQLVNKFAFHPDSENILQAHELPRGVEELVLVSDEGLESTSLFLPSADSEKLLIYFHGNAGNLYHRIPSLMQIHSIGVNVIGVGYRGYGKSEGSPSEEGIYRDGEAIFEYATSELGFREENIFILGRSIGTTVAIETAQYKTMGGLILVTPLTSGRAQAKQSGLGSISGLAGDVFDNIGKIANLETPLLVIHDTRDGVIPYAMGLEIFEAALVEKDLVTIEGAGHNNLHDQYARQYWLPILNFIQGS